MVGKTTAQEKAEFEWLVCFADVQPALLSVLVQYGTNARVLVAGCGYSNLSKGLHDCGYQNVFNIDSNQRVIEYMKERHTQCEKMTWNVSDLADPAGCAILSDEMFDVVVDKCCMDCVLCETNGADYISELTRVLSRSGVMCIVSLHGPEFLLPMLSAVELGFIDITHTVIQSSTAVGKKEREQLRQFRPVDVEANENAKTSIMANSLWGETGMFSPGEGYGSSTNLYLCKGRRVQHCQPCTSSLTTASQTSACIITSYIGTPALQASALSHTPILSRPNSPTLKSTHTSTQTIPKCAQVVPVDRVRLSERYSALLDDWFRLQAPMLTPQRESAIAKSFEQVYMNVRGYSCRADIYSDQVSEKDRRCNEIQSELVSNKSACCGGNGKEIALCIPSVYKILFTSLEQEHFPVDQFVEDYDEFRLRLLHSENNIIPSPTQPQVHRPTVVCGCMNMGPLPKENNPCKMPTEGNECRGLTANDAVEFLRMMQ
eukprot:CFRG7364T1